MTEISGRAPLPMTGCGRTFRSESAHSRAWLAWLPVIAGVAILYLPAYRDLSSVNANTEGAAQVPVCVAIWIWLVWQKRTIFDIPDGPVPASPLGWLLIATAGLMYAVGRSQEFYQLEIGSQVPLFVGTVLILLGQPALRKLWFLPIFLLLLIPVPGSLLNDVLVPLKKVVSTIVADGLFACGLPIARDGVVLYIGGYQLLIADACSGLNSMIALTAIGCLYLYLREGKGWRANSILLAAVLPIAFVANLVRVTGLVLITYVWGETAGQRFHDFAGVAEIGVAFGGLFLVEHAVRVPHGARSTAQGVQA
jgi:exosortase